MTFNFFKEGGLEAGVDEAGRGSIIGRVYAACVVWGRDIEYNPLYKIDDSKKISAKKREALKEYIEKNALSYGIGYCEPWEIDENNILVCSHWAMAEAIQNATKKIKPDYVLIDGNSFSSICDFETHLVVGGDAKYTSIGAASILAKTYHDEHIKKLMEENPELKEYGLEKHMGYGTKKHIEKIDELGLSVYHRKSYKCCFGKKNYKMGNIWI